MHKHSLHVSVSGFLYINNVSIHKKRFGNYNIVKMSMFFV